MDKGYSKGTIYYIFFHRSLCQFLSFFYLGTKGRLKYSPESSYLGSPQISDTSSQFPMQFHKVGLEYEMD